MKVSELWLRTFINPSLSIAELAEQLTNAGIEVDTLEMREAEDDTGRNLKSPKHLQEGILTLKVPPNRGDCLSVEGVARELSILNNMPYKAIPEIPLAENSDITLPIKIIEKKICPRYVGTVIKNIKKTSTPNWIKNRIEACGIRSVSMIVDVINYVMLELGQPMHAFDLNKLDTEIEIRKAKKGEKLALLDGQTIELQPETLVIADKSKVQAIAGVMGGLTSSVTENTQDIFIESAYFDPISIRLAASRYGIKTDSSHRFERGVDFNLQKRAIERARQLIVDIASEKESPHIGPILEEKSEDNLPSVPTIILRASRIKRILGISIEESEIISILNRSEMTVVRESKESNAKENESRYTVTPPSFRQDIVSEIDLIEEIARIYGLHRFESVPLSGSIPFFPVSEKELSKAKFKSMLIERGYNEAITYSFTDPKLTALLFPEQKTLSLANAISSEMATMRVSLWPGLLQAVQYNQRRQIFRTRLFEIGNCFEVDTSNPSEQKVIEKNRLSGVAVGPLFDEQWGATQKGQDFYDIKKDIEALLALTKENTFSFEKAEHSALHPGQTAKISRGTQLIGYVGALHPQIMKTLELEGPVWVFDLDMEALKHASLPIFLPLSKFPAIRRDLAILVDASIQSKNIKDKIEKNAGDLLQEVIIFDVYQGKGIDPLKKSIALGLILQHPSRTLVEGEVNSLVEQIVTMLSKEFNATLRE